MQLVFDHPPGINLVRRYGPGELLISDQQFARAVLVGPHFLRSDWAPQSLAELTNEDLTVVIEQRPDVLLLAQGSATPMPMKWLRQALEPHRVAVEFMSLGAGCRTYNILATEERAVLAALFPGNLPPA